MVTKIGRTIQLSLQASGAGLRTGSQVSPCVKSCRQAAQGAGYFPGFVTRDLVPKWRTYCFQFTVSTEIIGLNKDITSYKSTCFFW